MNPSFFLILIRSLMKKCPQCGKGKLFSSYLKLYKSCHICNEELSVFRTDDFGKFESGRDRAVRKRRMKEMSPEMPRDLLTAKTSDLLNYTQQLTIQVILYKLSLYLEVNLILIMLEVLCQILFYLM